MKNKKEGALKLFICDTKDICKKQDCKHSLPHKAATLQDVEYTCDNVNNDIICSILLQTIQCKETFLN